MGLIRKVASIMMLGGVSSHTRREAAGEGRTGPGLKVRDFSDGLTVLRTSTGHQP